MPTNLVIADKNRKGLMGPDHVRQLDRAVLLDIAQTITGIKSFGISALNIAGNFGTLRFSVGSPGSVNNWWIYADTGSILFLNDTNNDSNWEGPPWPFQVSTVGAFVYGIPVVTCQVNAIGSDANVTLSNIYRQFLHTGTLTTNRILTLFAANTVLTGTTLRITRTGAGAFTLSINTPAASTLKALSQNQWVDVTSDGASTWYLSGFGSL